MIIRKVKVTEYEYQAPINYVAGATEPDIQFQLTDYEIPSGATGRVYVGRSDGTFEYTVATISGNNVTVAPTSSMFSVKGPGAIQVTLYVGNEVVKNFAVPVYVHADLADDSAEAGSDVTGVFRAAEEQALADFAEDAEAKAAEVIESIPADYTELTEEVDELNERLDNLDPLSEDAKIALLNCFEHVAWVDEHGQDYYDALEDALYPDTGLVSITAVFTQGSVVIYPSTPLNDLKAYLAVTGHYNNGTSKTITDYALSGTLTEGISTITVTAEGRTTTFTVNVMAEWGDDYTWLYNPSDDGLLSARTDIVATTIGTGCVESLNDGILNLYVPENTNQIIRYNLNQSTNSNAKMTAKVRFKDTPIVSGAAGFRLQVSNGVSGTQIMEHRLRNQDPVYAYYESGNAILLNNIVTFDEWHIISVELNNNKQTITVDGVKVMESSTLSTNYCTLNSIIAQNVVDATNEHELDVDVAWITYKNND